MPLRSAPKNDPLGHFPDRSDTALIILDMISDFSFPDGAKVAKSALPVARRIAKLKARLKARGYAVVYVNDALGRWRSDFPGLVRHCAREGALGAPIVKALAPDPDDYCVLKPKHSGFFATALETLLVQLGTRRVILTGVSSNQCVLFTANDAYVRDLELTIPRDCISARTARETALALRYFTSVLGADVRPSSTVSAKRKSRASRR